MPIVKIVGVEPRNYTDKQTGESKSNMVVHYTHKINTNGACGIGAGNVFIDFDKHDIQIPEMGSIVLVEKNDKGYLTNIEYIQAAEKKPDGK